MPSAVRRYGGGCRNLLHSTLDMDRPLSVPITSGLTPGCLRRLNRKTKTFEYQFTGIAERVSGKRHHARRDGGL